MRAGYLEALASRTLGLAPVLRPASRTPFETHAPSPWGEVEEVREAAPALSGAPTSVPPSGGEERSRPALEVDGPLLGFREPERFEARRPERSDPAAGAPVSAPGETAVEAARPAAGGPFRAETHVAVAAVEARAAAAVEARPSSAGAGPVEGPVVRPPTTADEPTHGPARLAPSEAAPIVVRIGRVDVRAVHAPAPAVAPSAPTARPPAGPTLAEHLLARDRGRR
jgi:hypothetical protein